MERDCPNCDGEGTTVDVRMAGPQTAVANDTDCEVCNGEGRVTVSMRRT